MNVRPCSTTLLKSNIVYFLFLRRVCIYYLVYVKLVICKFSLIFFFLIFRPWRIIEIFLFQQQQTSITSHHYIKGLLLICQEIMIYARKFIWYNTIITRKMIFESFDFLYVALRLTLNPPD